jgi:plasmid stabilization system protein ParE
MPRARVVFSLDAESDLALFDWIARDSGLDRAEAVLRRIDETVELIATIPGIGRVRQDLDGGPRTFAVWPRVIVYEPLPAGPGIAVWRVIDGRRDLGETVRQ